VDCVLKPYKTLYNVVGAAIGRPYFFEFVGKPQAIDEESRNFCKKTVDIK
jgi:hypothetical protein